MAGAQPSHHSTLERSLIGSGDADSLRLWKGPRDRSRPPRARFRLLILVSGRGHRRVAGEADRSACRPNDRPCAAERTLATLFFREPRKASTSGGSRLTLPRLGRRFSPGIGRKTYPSLSRVLLKLKRGRRPCCVFVVSARPPTVACRRGAEGRHALPLRRRDQRADGSDRQLMLRNVSQAFWPRCVR
jgi:hypothetical protein